MIRRYQNKDSRHGFTLLELMVVIVILGVLIAAGLGSFTSSQQKSRDSRRKSDLRSIAQALELYYNDKGRYPNSDGNGNISGCGTGDASLCPWGEQFSDSKGTIYMVKLPADPGAGRKYYYRKSGVNYQLYAGFENTEDPDYNASGYSGTNCASTGTFICNYGIASSNLAP